ncbi:MAG TPA: S-adenosylhomocysteine deaminase [Syntrophaceae bacterium]|nr:S-adenosylhomocysteine deaminase [Syntrophaceae bacterium]
MIEVDCLISGGRILVMDEKETLIPRGTIAIKGENIVAVGKKEEIENLYTSREILSVEDSLVMPGLVNCHTHAPMTYFRGLADDLELMDWLNNYIFPAEAAFVNREFSYMGSLLACAEMIKSGTTTFCDMYIFEDEVAKAAKKAGMRCRIGEVLFDFPSPNVKTPAEGLNYTEMLIGKWAHDPLVSIVVEPHSLYTCSESLLKEAKKLADRYSIPLAMHYLETKSEREQLIKDKGRNTPTSYLQDIDYLSERFIAFHCVWMEDSDIQMFADYGSKIVHNPESNMKLASGAAPVPKMLTSGVTVALGTDGCASNNNLDMFQEMDTAAKLHKVVHHDPTVMDARTVVRMATCDGAKALCLDNTVGALTPGMKADIIIINLNRPHLTPLYNEYSHIVYAVNGSDVDTVLINGKVIMKNRTLLTIDENDIIEMVKETSQKIRKSLKIT